MKRPSTESCRQSGLRAAAGRPGNTNHATHFPRHRSHLAFFAALRGAATTRNHRNMAGLFKRDDDGRDTEGKSHPGSQQPPRWGWRAETSQRAPRRAPGRPWCLCQAVRTLYWRPPSITKSGHIIKGKRISIPKTRLDVLKRSSRHCMKRPKQTAR